MSEAKDILERAKHRIRTPSRWVSHWCVSEDGKRVCAAQAIAEASGARCIADITGDGAEALKALANVSGINPRWTDADRVTYLNGSRHRDVMAAFDQAIASLEEATP